MTGVSGLETAISARARHALAAGRHPEPGDRPAPGLPGTSTRRGVVWLEYAQGRPVARRSNPDHRDLRPRRAATDR